MIPRARLCANPWLPPTLTLGLWILLACIQSAAADSIKIRSAEGFWAQTVAEGNLSFIDSDLSKVRLWLEGQGRFDNQNPEGNMNWYQGMARTALGYAITDRLTIWTGYTYIPTHRYERPFNGEQQVWPAVRYNIPTALGTLTLREMIEVRFAGGDVPSIRPRQLIRLLHPFEFEPRLGLLIWDEVFFNLNNVPNLKGYGYSGFDQNRAFVGLTWTFNEFARTELGYMNLIAIGSKPDEPVTRYNELHTVFGSVFLAW